VAWPLSAVASAFEPAAGGLPPARVTCAASLPISLARSAASTVAAPWRQAARPRHPHGQVMKADDLGHARASRCNSTADSPVAGVVEGVTAEAGVLVAGVRLPGLRACPAQAGFEVPLAADFGAFFGEVAPVAAVVVAVERSSRSKRSTSCPSGRGSRARPPDRRGLRRRGRRRRPKRDRGHRLGMRAAATPRLTQSPRPARPTGRTPTTVAQAARDSRSRERLGRDAGRTQRRHGHRLRARRREHAAGS
jgi:hypothetical protein